MLQPFIENKTCAHEAMKHKNLCIRATKLTVIEHGASCKQTSIVLGTRWSVWLSALLYLVIRVLILNDF